MDDAWHDRLRDRARDASVVVLVEGVSDVAAIETLAARRGVEPAESGAVIVAMGGATNIRRYLAAVSGLGLRGCGLVDAAEAGFFARALSVDPEQLPDRGFFVCDPDLEVELMRALGTERTIEVLADEGDLPLWQTFSNQPFQRGRSVEERLHRFFGTTSGRKERYGRALVDGLDGAAAPAPLMDLLAFIGAHRS